MCKAAYSLDTPIPVALGTRVCISNFLVHIGSIIRSVTQIGGSDSAAANRVTMSCGLHRSKSLHTVVAILLRRCCSEVRFLGLAVDFITFITPFLEHFVRKMSVTQVELMKCRTLPENRRACA